eukprot:TRINITY_DN5580_c0_g2_i1.p1 TRINITY_DN5580_c0_g2~~TRINITY_DN5580_c0_g2_i1.p1  ORF type:complete len:280 (-),score=59.62 TRINITY_DN5580_c0_g2_i1:99-938(-)
MGYANVLDFAGIKIGGLSGIYKRYHFRMGHFEKPPYNDETIRSVYHQREIDVFKLLQLSGSPNIFLSHDWPLGIHKDGNTGQLLRQKKHFKEDIDKNELGSPALEKLLRVLQPEFWFAAHLHVKFPAVVRHDENGEKTTRFLSLDKCLPSRDFLQVIKVDCDPLKDKVLRYDREWLAILKSTQKFDLMDQTRFIPIPNITNKDERYDFRPTAEELSEIDVVFKESDYVIPENFELTAPTYSSSRGQTQVQEYINPQTTNFSQKLFGSSATTTTTTTTSS